MNLMNLHVVGGGTVRGLTDTGIQLVKWAREDGIQGPHALYVIAGIPDTTKMMRRGAYEEVVFNEDPSEAATRIVELYREADTLIRAEGIVPCFSTITTMSIREWNKTRLTQHRTTHLLHYKHY